MSLYRTVSLVLLGLALMQSQETGTASGTLRNPDGSARSGFRVAAMVVLSEGVQNDATSLISLTETDKDGRFRLEKIPPGRYYIIAGAVLSPTYYPGVLDTSTAQIISVAARAELTGLDFVVMTASIPIPFPTSRPGTPVSGRVITDDGSPLPSVPLVVNVSSTARPAGEPQFRGLAIRANGEFNSLIPEGEYRVWISGLPLGYSLKSISYGRTPLGLGPITVGPQPEEVLLRLAIIPLGSIQTVKVDGRVANVASELELHGRKVRLVSEGAGRPTLETELMPDHTFTFEKVPPETYRTVITHLAGDLDVTLSTISVYDNNVQRVTIDLNNNPFPGYPGGGYSSLFDSNNRIILRGVLTQPIVRIATSAPAQFFRMDVRDEAAGLTVPWAIMLTSKTPPQDIMNSLGMVVGDTVVVTGSATNDATHRLIVDIFPGKTSTINGREVPNLSLP